MSQLRQSRIYCSERGIGPTCRELRRPVNIWLTFKWPVDSSGHYTWASTSRTQAEWVRPWRAQVASVQEANAKLPSLTSRVLTILPTGIPFLQVTVTVPVPFPVSVHSGRLLPNRVMGAVKVISRSWIGTFAPLQHSNLVITVGSVIESSLA